MVMTAGETNKAETERERCGVVLGREGSRPSDIGAQTSRR